MNISKYKDFLKKEVFKTEEFFQFNLLFNDLEKIKKLKYNHAVIIERSYMYDNKSIFIPLMNQKKKNTSINFLISNSKKRKGIQNDFLDEAKINFIKSDLWIQDCKNNYKYNFKIIDCDFLMIPNSLHHISDFPLLLKQLIKKMPKLKHIYIFDSYLREGHQKPNDYCRYTVFALENLMKNNNFKLIKKNETGNIFDALLYLFSQSKELLKEKELNQIKLIFDKKLKKNLINERHKKKWSNLGRKFATMHTAYSIYFKKYEKKN